LKFQIEFLFESGFERCSGIFDYVCIDGCENGRDFGAAKGADDFGDEVLADIFPELGSVGFVYFEEDRTFDEDGNSVFGGGFDGLVAQDLAIFEIKTLVDRIFQNLRIEELGDLPERNLQVEAGAVDILEHTAAAIVDAGNMTGWNRDEKSPYYLVSQERDH
jgi:hypothetical protein